MKAFWIDRLLDDTSPRSWTDHPLTYRLPNFIQHKIGVREIQKMAGNYVPWHTKKINKVKKQLETAWYFVVITYFTILYVINTFRYNVRSTWHGINFHLNAAYPGVPFVTYVPQETATGDWRGGYKVVFKQFIKMRNHRRTTK